MCSYTVTTVQQTIDAREVAIAFLTALRISELTCNTKQLQQNLIFLNKVAFAKMREGKLED